MNNRSKGSSTWYHCRTAPPDEPQIPGCTQLTPADSNSCLHLTKLNRSSSPHVVGRDGGVTDFAYTYSSNTLRNLVPGSEL